MKLEEIWENPKSQNEVFICHIIAWWEPEN